MSCRNKKADDIYASFIKNLSDSEAKQIQKDTNEYWANMRQTPKNRMITCVRCGTIHLIDEVHDCIGKHRIRYDCKDNDNHFYINFLDGKIDELEIGDSLEQRWIVISFKDLENALDFYGYAIVEKS